MPRLTASFGAMRAISVATIKQMLRPVALMGAIILGSLYCMTIFLALSFSGWWWLLLVLLIPLTVICIVIILVLLYLLRALMPRGLDKEGQAKLDKFAEKLLGVIERSRFSYPVILFLIAKDVIRKKESSFLRDMIGDSQTLTREFGEICRLFEK